MIKSPGIFGWLRGPDGDGESSSKAIIAGSGHPPKGNDLSNTPGFNQYSKYETQVKATYDRLEGTESVGCSLIQGIFEYLSSWIVGSEIEITGKSSKENEFLKSWAEINDFTEEKGGLEQYVETALAEGQILASTHFIDGTLQLRRKRWRYYRYQVRLKNDDYKTIESVSWEKKGDLETGDLKSGDFIYRKFFGAEEDPESVRPVTAGILHHIDEADKALSHWDKLKSRDGNSFLYFECNEPGSAHDLRAEIIKQKWRAELSRPLAGSAKAMYIVVPPHVYESLQKNRLEHIRPISARTGIPIIFFGYAGEPNATATAGELTKTIASLTRKYRNKLASFLADAARIAIERESTENNRALSASGIRVKIHPPTEDQIKQDLMAIHYPIWLNKGYDLQSFLELVPGANPERVQKRLESESKKESLPPMFGNPGDKK